MVNEAGAGFRQHLNETLSALNTTHAGNTPPTVTQPYMSWLDTSVSPPQQKRRNATDTDWEIVTASGTGGSTYVSVKDSGAVGDGVTDDTSAIQSAINTVQGFGGGVVFFPTGTYKTTSTLNVTSNAVYLLGEGRQASIIAPTAMSTANILFNGVSQGGLDSLAIIPSALGATAAVRLTNCHNTTITNFLISGNSTIGVWVQGGASQFLSTISDFEIAGCSTAGIQIGGGSGLVQDTTVSNGIIASCYNGILLTNSSGTYISAVDVISSINAGVATYPATGEKTTACLFDRVLADTSAASGFSFFNNGGTVTDINLVNCWSATNNQHGFHFANGVNGVLMSGCRVINNKRHGILIEGGANYTINGCQVGMNSMQGGALYSGIAVGAGVSHFNISSCVSGERLGNIGNLTTNLQKYGVMVASGASDYYVISGNDLSGNMTAALNDAGTGTNKFISQNLGVAGGSSVGEVNTASNIGVGGTGVYKQKIGLDLQFKKLKAGTNVTIADTANDEILISATSAGGANLSTQNDWAKTQRITGLQLPTSGSGLELHYDTGASTSYITSYNRGSSTFLGMNLQASGYVLQAAGVNMLTLTNTSASFGATPTFPTPATSTNSTAGATTAFVKNVVGSRSRRGVAAVTIAADGTYSISHGLGSTPSAIQLTCVTSASKVVVGVNSYNSNTITGYARDLSLGGALMTSGLINVCWEVHE